MNDATAPATDQAAEGGAPALALIGAALVEHDGELPEALAALPAIGDVMQADLLASRLLSVLDDLRSQQSTFELLLAAETDQLRRRYRRLTEPLATKAEAIEYGLELLARQVPFPKGAKSRKVGSGSYGLRSVPAALEVVDEAEVLVWAASNLPAAVVTKTVTTLSKRDLSEHFKTSGEVPPGCQTRDAYDKLSLTFAEHLTTANATQGGSK
jgi:hypothetical protein